MAHSDEIPSIQPKTPGLLTREECAKFLNVGHNEISGIMRRFEVPALEGLYPERAIWKRILGVEPRDEPAMQALRLQLQDINWMVKTIGESASSIRRKIAAGTFDWPTGIQLGCLRADRKPPRLRRWMPRVVLARRDAVDLTSLQFLEDVMADAPEAEAGDVQSARISDAYPTDQDREDPENNVFAQIVRDNAQ
ncbi:hypothetical protein [Solirhodobacter olei]|uniref:hypothetical protein n=1 Tax=Solirhodobacter olei TaxID=2493082 RepID=UPI000FDC5A5A|nr:hypothetical protein [Solirhodobacter olei]